MELKSQSFQDGQPLDPKFAFGKMDPVSHVTLSSNLSPHLSWSDVPSQTQSFVLVCVDKDVPSKRDDVNQEDREVPADLPRTTFYHWVLVDIPADLTGFEEGIFSKGITPKGKSGPSTIEPMRHGINDFTAWFANDHDMKGEYYGYDGPCPPFNDALAHRYFFILYALDIPKVPLEGTFTAPQVLEKIQSHVLAQASIFATYSLNPRLANK